MRGAAARAVEAPPLELWLLPELKLWLPELKLWLLCELELCEE